MTKQQMFNRAYRGLASQKWKQSIGANENCLYNGPRGRHCAWGWVDTKIPDEHNGAKLSLLRQNKIGVAAKLSRSALAFACDLQCAHDLSDSPSGMRKAMEDLAAKHGLRIPVIK